MKKIVTLSLLLVAAVNVNAQRLALYAGGGIVRDLLRVEREDYKYGSIAKYKGRGGMYVEVLATTTLKNRIEIIAGIRAMAATVELDYNEPLGGYGNHSYPSIAPQLGIGYNRKATLSFRGGIMVSRHNPPSTIYSVNSVVLADYSLKSSFIFGPYASVGYKNIMLNAAFSYGLSRAIEDLPNSNAKLLTIGLIYRFPIIK